MAVSSADLKSVLSLLDSNRLEVRRQATAVVKALSADAAALFNSLDEDDRQVLGSRLLAAADLRDLQTAEDALASLVNLTQEEVMQTELLRQKAITRCLSWLKAEKSKKHAELVVMLLANLTTAGDGAKHLTQDTEWLLLLERVRQVPAGAVEADPYAHVASILTNVAREAAARRCLLAKSAAFPALVAEQLQSPSLVRRRGFSSALRNVLLKAEEDGLLGESLADDGSFSIILDRLCGGDSEGKDGDSEVRAALAEAIWILAQTNDGIDLLWKLGAPEKLRKGYEDEEDEKACAAMEATAEVFLSAA